MLYQEFLPPPLLTDYVKYTWVLESNERNTYKTFATIADGLPGMIFQQSDQGDFYQFNKRLPPMFLYGQTTRNMEIRSPASFRNIGVYFYPHALKALFGIDAHELTDTCIDLSRYEGWDIAEQLLNTPSSNSRVSLVHSFLQIQLQKSRYGNDGPIRYSLDKITNAGGLVSLVDLRQEMNLSERTFERKFNQFVGISPKLFANICRFQAGLKQLRENRFHKLADIAYENGYADQSHFIRVFKTFTGLSPLKYYRQSVETVENFPELNG